MTPEEERRTHCAHCGKVIYPGTPRVTLTFCSHDDLDRWLEDKKEED
ncbi:hypothetical protein LCGC14_0906900 [marine sediment metagenome]|uniref:Uncharacterized protein n=1 Tax=marine sediment metagenome TaxID=412755 RepID=A0A0F9NUS0_9ZZZZ